MVYAKELQKELKSLDEGFVLFVETHPENVLDLGLKSLKTLTDKKFSAIVLSVNRPFTNILDLYRKNKIDANKVYVIDCISKNQNISIKKPKNVNFIDSAASLTDILITVKDLATKVSGKKFLFIDSITTMLVFNKPEIFAKFIHQMLTKLRMYNISGLMVALEGQTNHEIRDEIAQLCDKVIKY